MTTDITDTEIEQATDDALNRFVELLVFGDDLTADSTVTLRTDYVTVPRLVFAVIDWAKDNRKRIEGWGDKMFHYPNDIWNNRDGEPWQADIEAHVAAWRAKPRDFIGDGNMERVLEDAIIERGWYYDFSRLGNLSRACIYHPPVNLIVSVKCDSKPVALCRAACLACLKQDGSE